MNGLALNESPLRLDRLQLAAIVGLMVVGVAFIFSATMVGDAAPAKLVQQVWFRQIVWYFAGIMAAAVICLIDYHILTRWALVMYWGTILMLVGVMIFGSDRGGARRWFDLGFFSLQPSEFAKLSFIISMAAFLSRPADELRLPENFWKAIGMMALPFALILKEPDLGSALVFVPTGCAMMLVAGVPMRFLARLSGVVGLLAMLILVDVLFAPPGWWKIKLEEYQRQRLLVYFGVDFAARDASPQEKARAAELQRAKSHQITQAMISVGSGGLLGKGWCKGEQTRLGFLPRFAAHNDFIFSVIAEEKGFVGTVGVLTLYAVILFTGLRIAGQARDRLGKVMAVGVVTLLFSHIFINIGMNIRLMPVTGIPLPLLSYGGSSVIASLIAMGMLQNVYIHRKGY